MYTIIYKIYWWVLEIFFGLVICYILEGVVPLYIRGGGDSLINDPRPRWPQVVPPINLRALLSYAMEQGLFFTAVKLITEIMAENTEPCTCGQVHSEYYPEENQHEPACWECYSAQMDMRDDTKEDFPY